MGLLFGTQKYALSTEKQILFSLIARAISWTVRDP